MSSGPGRSRNPRRLLVLVLLVAGAGVLAIVVGGGGPPAPAPPAAPVAVAPPAAVPDAAPLDVAPHATVVARGATDEQALLRRIEAQVGPAPETALALIAEHEARFPGSHSAARREALAIDALVDLGRIGAARTRAFAFFEAHPREHELFRRIEARTGAHPRPSNRYGR